MLRLLLYQRYLPGGTMKPHCSSRVALAFWLVLGALALSSRSKSHEPLCCRRSRAREAVSPFAPPRERPLLDRADAPEPPCAPASCCYRGKHLSPASVVR